MEYSAPYPHCDSNVLHAPGECEYCDHYPVEQQARVTAGTPFTGHGADPATAVRPLETINLWPGNRARQPGLTNHQWWHGDTDISPFTPGSVN